MTRTYFITASAYMHQNFFQRNETVDFLLSTIFRKRDAGEFGVHEFVIMPNHMHLLLTVDDDHSIVRAMQLIKGGFSHAMGQAGLKLRQSVSPAITSTVSAMRLNMSAYGTTSTRIRFVADS